MNFRYELKVMIKKKTARISSPFRFVDNLLFVGEPIVGVIASSGALKADCDEGLTLQAVGDVVGGGESPGAKR